MIASISLLLTSAALSFASPLEKRVVTSLNQAAFEEAQQRDDTATRAFSGTEIKTSDGKCLFVDKLSGDFRANLNPIQVANCDGSTGQKWDIITAGKHNDQAGTMLIVNTLTQACANFDPRRAAGNTVIMFSCGGRADGGGQVTNSQLFGFAGGAGPLSFEPKNAAGTCLAVTANNVLDQAPCKAGDASQSFTFGGASTGGRGGAASKPGVVSATAETIQSSTPEAASPAATPPAEVAAPAAGSGCTLTTVITMIRPESSVAPAIDSAVSKAVSETATAPEATSPPAVGNIPSVNPTTPVPVSRAGGTLNPTSAAQAHQRDDTATRAFTSVSLKSANGQCLFIDPTAGDFRQNLIPIAVQPCTGSANEKFDLITKGKHNNAVGATLVVSSLMQGCLSFDARRAAGDTAHIFSCGGRADGEGETTNSQLFDFTGGNTITLAPQNGDGQVCLVPKGAKLDQAACSGAADVYTIVQ
ncbi:hypothetical protein ONS95_005739 [Cadophora gregata]|uniref:uncharacterized protein n=1 Tax=Cadophora gregata TaxID=51156 RepID=UPI0026DB7951|nr:uncharacterized protein ONS95_005739 [Cadophora gregata]KAK0103733.1 hypothetical protein ONS95_005739 [Cadophora gregata]